MTKSKLDEFVRITITKSSGHAGSVGINDDTKLRTLGYNNDTEIFNLKKRLHVFFKEDKGDKLPDFEHVFIITPDSTIKNVIENMNKVTVQVIPDKKNNFLEIPEDHTVSVELPRDDDFQLERSAPTLYGDDGTENKG